MNTLPVRIRILPEFPVLKYLEELRTRSLAAREHEHTPLAKIHEWSDVSQEVPLFETLVVFGNYSLDSTLRVQGENRQKREFKLFGQTNYPLTLAGYGDATLLLNLRYDRRRFEGGTVRCMLAHLQTLLRSFVSNPGQKLSEISLLTETERHQL